VSDVAALTPDARRQRARAVLGGVGLLLLAVVLARAYTEWTSTRYSPPLPAAMIDVNREDATTLEVLPGIGPTLARRIVDERAGRGPFRDFADLRARVDGIGTGLAAVLDGRVAFGPAVR